MTFFTYNVKILFQFGVSVLYSVWVCKRALSNSKTQKGSDFPPISAAARPDAPYTLTVRWPTSRSFWTVLMSLYRDLIASSSFGFSRYAVRSLIVSNAVVPLMVKFIKTSPWWSSNCCHIACVVSRGSLDKSIVQRPSTEFLLQRPTSRIWSSSKRWKSNCSNHRARYEVLLLYFSFPSLQIKKKCLASAKVKTLLWSNRCFYCIFICFSQFSSLLRPKNLTQDNLISILVFR